MTTRFPSRPAPAWMLEHRGKIVAALIGGLTAVIAVVGSATWAVSDGGDTGPSTSTVTYPSSREGVRGQVDFDNSESLGLTTGAFQPSSAEPKFPASRENARGQVFEVGGVANAAIQSSAADPTFPASRENVRGHVFDGAETSAISAALRGSVVEPIFPPSRDGQRGHIEGDGSQALGATAAAMQPSEREARVPSNAANARGPVFD
jgi:hypothetical protein